MADLMVVDNPCCRSCRGRPCFRALCRDCASYLSAHERTPEACRADAEGWAHRCTPQGRAWTQIEAQVARGRA